MTGNTLYHLVRQSGGERRSYLPGLVIRPASCFASRSHIGRANRCPWPSAADLVTQLLGRRPVEGWRRVRLSGDTRRQPVSFNFAPVAEWTRQALYMRTGKHDFGNVAARGIESRSGHHLPSASAA